MTGNTFEFSHVILPKLLSSRKTSRDPRDIRLAAVTSAIVETANERRAQTGSNDNNSEKSSNKATAYEIYAISLTALEGTITIHDDNEKDSSPQFPLLQILEQTIPHVPPSFYLSQFSLLSRLLRGITTASKGAGIIGDLETKDELGGQNAKLRQLIKTSKQAISFFINNSSDISGLGVGGGDKDKAILKLLDGTCMTLFHDKRPKVRKLAQTSILELLAMGMDEDGDCMDNSMASPTSILIRTHIGEYIRAIFSHFEEKQLTQNKKDNDDFSDTMVKMMHLMQFCEGACKYLPAKFQIGDDAVKLIVSIMTSLDETKHKGMPISMGDTQNNEAIIMLVNSLLNILTTIIENEIDETMQTTVSSEVKELSGKTLASLIQLSPSFKSYGSTKSLNSNSNEAMEECKIRQSQLLVSCSVALRYTSAGMKLLPIAMSLISNHCDSSGAGMACIQSCASELQRLIRTCTPLSGNEAENEVDQKQSLLACNDCITKLLHHRYRPYWDVILPAYSLFITKLGGSENTEDMVKTLVRNLVELHENINDEVSVKAIETNVGSAIQGLGIEVFWKFVPLDEINGDTGKKSVVSNVCISQDRSWLVPLLNTHTKLSSEISPRLGFFQTTVLGVARKCDGLSAKPGLTALEMSIAKSQCIEMWSLLGGFCENHPLDIVESFPRLAQTFAKAITDKRYPQLIAIISTGIHSLAASTYEQAQQKSEDERAQADLKTISKMSEKLLPTLFKLVDSLSMSIQTTSKSPDAMDTDEQSKKSNETQSTPQETTQKIHHVTMAIQSLAKITSAAFLQTMFQKLLTRLLKASTDSENCIHQISSLLNLAQALVSSSALDENSVSLLYRAIKPLIRTDEFSPNIQKRAYKVMASLCEHYTQFIVGEKLNEVIELMVGSLMTCQIAARSVRLHCLEYVVNGLDCKNSKQMAIIPQMMGEVLLCLKDSNAKTRESAYQVLLGMSRLHQRASGSLQEFFTIILGALGGQTPQMRSAAVMALSRLVFEYARDDDDVQELLPSLLQTVMVLFDENSREVIKSVIGFVRISVAAMKSWQLEPLLADLLEGLFKYDKGKGRFRSKIKIILKKLVKIYGYEKLSPLVPEGRLVNHMRKMDERAKRRKEALKAQGLEAESDFEGMMDSDEDDSDDGRTLMTGVTGFTKMTAKSGKTLRTAAMEKTIAKSRATKSVMSTTTSGTKLGGSGDGGGPRIQKERNGEIFDLLDPRMSKHVHFQETQGDNDNDFDDDDDDSGIMEFDDKGRLVIHDDEYTSSSKINKNEDTFDDDDEDDDIENAQIKRGGKRMKMSKFEDAKLAKAKANKQRSQKKQNVKSLGSEYKSKKAGGDVKKKGQKYEPYAFVPLDGKSYTKKNRRKAVDQMGTVVKTGKRKNR